MNPPVIFMDFSAWSSLGRERMLGFVSCSSGWEGISDGPAFRRDSFISLPKTGRTDSPCCGMATQGWRRVSSMDSAESPQRARG